jgi:hypothetical protein
MAEVNTPLVAVALKVYELPLVKPVTVQFVAAGMTLHGVPTAFPEESYAEIV